MAGFSQSPAMITGHSEERGSIWSETQVGIWPLREEGGWAKKKGEKCPSQDNSEWPANPGHSQDREEARGCSPDQRQRQAIPLGCLATYRRGRSEMRGMGKHPRAEHSLPGNKCNVFESSPNKRWKTSIFMVVKIQL